MRMRLSECRVRDLHEPSFFFQGLDILASAVAHPGSEATHQLEDRVLDRALVGDTSLDALRYQLLRSGLEITVLAAVLHRCDGAHAAVYLVLSALIKLELTRCLITARKQRSHHTDIRPRGDSLREVA